VQLVILCYYFASASVTVGIEHGPVGGVA